MAIISGKKAIFFSAIAILMSAVIITVFATPRTTTTKYQLPLLEARSEAVSSQAKDLRYNYLPQSLYIASYTAFSAFAEYERQRGAYLPTEEIFNVAMKEAIVNGTICCSLPSSSKPCTDSLLNDQRDPLKHVSINECLGSSFLSGQPMKPRTLSNRLSEMEEASLKAYRINTLFPNNYADMLLTLYQDNETGPWQVRVNLTMNYSVFAGNVMVNSSENITTTFGIEGIQDPLYAVGSKATAEDGNTEFTNYFNMTNITNWNISTFYHEIEWRLYKHDGNAPNFLMRFIGQDKPSECCGVESLINPVTMSQVTGDRERPYVDWCYYGPADRCSSESFGTLWNVRCVTTSGIGTKFYRFRIDTTHALRYNLSNDQRDYLYGAGPEPACTETPFP